MTTGMLQRSGMFNTTLLNGRRPAVSLPLGGSRKSAPSYTVCSANKQESEPLHVAKMATAALAASLLLSAALPEDALAARSGGRVGGSSFRSSAPRAAPRAAPSPRSRCVIYLFISGEASYRAALAGLTTGELEIRVACVLFRVTLQYAECYIVEAVCTRDRCLKHS